MRLRALRETVARAGEGPDPSLRAIARIAIRRAEDVPTIPVGALLRHGADRASQVVRGGRARDWWLGRQVDPCLGDPQAVGDVRHGPMPIL
ncbi:MAG: hypothetical protein ACK4TJ_00575 [Tabrizicola sp.]